jgi:hypothetical protein
MLHVVVSFHRWIQVFFSFRSRVIAIRIVHCLSARWQMKYHHTNKFALVQRTRCLLALVIQRTHLIETSSISPLNYKQFSSTHGLSVYAHVSLTLSLSLSRQTCVVVRTSEQDRWNWNFQPIMFIFVDMRHDSIECNLDCLMCMFIE